MIQKKVTDFFALEGNYPDLDGEGAAARLSAAIRCKTINYFDHSRTDYTEFDKLHAHIKASYPNIMRVGTFERIGRAHHHPRQRRFSAPLPLHVASGRRSRC